MTEKTTHITHVGTVIVPVSDQDRALEFYVGELGFETRIDGTYGEGERWVEVAPPGATTTIALVLAHGAPAGVEVSFATENAEADHAELRARVSTPTRLSSTWSSSHRCSRSAIRTATGSGWSSAPEHGLGKPT